MSEINNNPYRPILPPKAGYVEQDGEYVKIQSETDQRIETVENITEIEEALKILLGEKDDELDW